MARLDSWFRLAAKFTGYAVLLFATGCGREADPERNPRNPPPAQAPALEPADPPARPAVPSGSAHAWLIVGGHSVGAITDTTDEEGLRRIYGGTNVRSIRVSLGEGEYEVGTAVFAGDSLRRLEILWADPEHRRPARIIVRGERSRWRTSHGLTLGTTLRELEEMNRRPFTLTGAGWDYAGTVTSWNGGRLEADVAVGKAYVRLPRGDLDRLSVQEQRRILGDREYSSSMPEMQKWNPRVGEIVVVLRD